MSAFASSEHADTCGIGSYVPEPAVSKPSKGCPYSITSSARAMSEGGVVMPSALPVSRLITSSNLVLVRAFNGATHLNEADEIADSFHPISDIVCDFDAELIFNHDHQFEAVEPVGPEISAKVCLIGDELEIDT